MASCCPLPALSPVASSILLSAESSLCHHGIQDGSRQRDPHLLTLKYTLTAQAFDRQTEVCCRFRIFQEDCLCFPQNRVLYRISLNDKACQDKHES